VHGAFRRQIRIFSILDYNVYSMELLRWPLTDTMLRLVHLATVPIASCVSQIKSNQMFLNKTIVRPQLYSDTNKIQDRK